MYIEAKIILSNTLYRYFYSFKRIGVLLESFFRFVIKKQSFLARESFLKQFYGNFWFLRLVFIYPCFLVSEAAFSMDKRNSSSKAVQICSSSSKNNCYGNGIIIQKRYWYAHSWRFATGSFSLECNEEYFF